MGLVIDPAHSILSRPAVGCRLVRTSSLNIATASGTSIPAWDGETFDTHGFHSTSTDPDRITIPAGCAGLYLVTGQVHLSANATGRRTVTVRLNGNQVMRESTNAPASGVASLSIALPQILAVDDYLTVEVYQDSGVTLTLDNSTQAARASFSVVMQGTV